MNTPKIESSLLDVDAKACRQRQSRLLQWMHANDIEWAVWTSIEHIQYFIGPRFPWTFEPVATMDGQGYVTLVAPEKKMPNLHAADEIVSYEAQWRSTLRNDQRLESCKILQQAVPELKNTKRIAIEFSNFSKYFVLADHVQLVDMEPELLRLRRHKDADELAKIEKAIAGTEKMYQRARELIRPGINELEVFNELQSAAVLEFGEMMTGTGNDYRCNARGGPPRDRLCGAGELYILDLGPAYRGYFADNARTIAVSDVNSEQQLAWEFLMRVFDHIQSNVVPGKSCQELFDEVQEILDECSVGVFNHHLGHGIGLFPHEGPHLNPNWDDTFQVGDVFTAEPGLYGEPLIAGMRIENDYLVTPKGVRCLTNFPLELKL